MGTIYKRRLADGRVTWYINYSVNGRRIREAVGPDKKQAEQSLRARLGEIAQGRFSLARVKRSPRFADFAKEYLDYSMGHNKAWDRKASILRNLEEDFRDLRLNQITPWLIEKYKAKRREVVKPSTVNRELATLKHLFNLAIKWGRAERNPVREVEFYRVENRGLRFLTDEEIPRLIEACSETLRPVVITAICTGMRRGELLGLRWEDVDFSRRVLTVWASKNRESREIAMNTWLTETLRPLSIGKRAGDPVFLKESGNPYTEITKAFKRAIKKAEIAPCRLHDLRHTFASHLVMGGADLVTVKDLLGHKSIEMTMRYAHLSQEHRRKAVEILDRHVSVTRGVIPISVGRVSS